jgi:protocatechuate 3,4-dioxygenase alpha subunit
MNASHGQTPSQTIGPFFAYALTAQQYGYDFPQLFGPDLAQPHTPGEHILITGRVFDGQGASVGDAMLEISHADARGHSVHDRAQVQASGFRGFGRMGTGTLPGHVFAFRTIKPGTTGDGQAPHINLILTMRGLLNHLFTRIYFDDEVAANGADPVLASVPPERRATLIARREEQPGLRVYHVDIRMQGDAETVFFDV